MKILHISIILLGALTLLAMATGIYLRARSLPSWIRWSCLLLSTLLITWGVVSYLSKFESASLTYAERWRAYGIEMWLGGMGVGVFVSLLMLGEFLELRRKPSRGIEQKIITEHMKPTEVE